MHSSNRQVPSGGGEVVPTITNATSTGPQGVLKLVPQPSKVATTGSN